MYHRLPEPGGAAPLASLNDRRQRAKLPRLPSQRREAFRLSVRMPVYVDYPMEMFCELRDISYTGVGFDRELPCTPGITVGFRLEVPTYGATPKPVQIHLVAEVVRVERGQTGLRFVGLDRLQARAVSEIVTTQQRMMLAARRSREDTRSFRG